MPSTVPVCVTPCSTSSERAMPKSVTFASPSARQQHVLRLHVAVHEPVLVRERERVGDLRAPSSTARRTGSGPVRSTSCFRFSPSTYSKTMNCWPSSSPRSMTVTMFGCESCATDARLAPEALDVLRRRRRSAGAGSSARRCARAACRAPCRRSTCRRCRRARRARSGRRSPHRAWRSGQGSSRSAVRPRA